MGRVADDGHCPKWIWHKNQTKCLSHEFHRAHPHKLVGKDICSKGVCTLEINNETMTATFANLGIQCVKKKDIDESLKEREKIRVDPFRSKTYSTHFRHGMLWYDLFWLQRDLVMLHSRQALIWMQFDCVFKFFWKIRKVITSIFHSSRLYRNRSTTKRPCQVIT